jgi:calcineurin-like phosphoesterase family protein
VLNINIGTDAWHYRPVSESELDAYIGKILVGKA